MKLHLFKLFSGFIILLITSCNNTNSNIYNKPSEFNDKRESFIKMFKYHNISEISSYSLAKDFKDGTWLLKKVEQKDNAKFLPPNLLNDFQLKAAKIYLYGIKKYDTHIISFVEIVQTQGYVGSVLVSINLNNFEIIDYVELEGGFCPGPYQDQDDNVIWCDKKSAYFDNDNLFKILTLKSNSDDYVPGCAMRVDSIVNFYKLGYDGVITQIKKDSIRYNTTLK